MTLPAALRMLRNPTALLFLILFIGAFVLATSDAWGYADGLPKMEVEQELVDGDPDLPAGFHAGGMSADREVGFPGSSYLVVRTLLELTLLLP